MSDFDEILSGNDGNDASPSVSDASSDASAESVTSGDSGGDDFDSIMNQSEPATESASDSSDSNDGGEPGAIDPAENQPDETQAGDEPDAAEPEEELTDEIIAQRLDDKRSPKWWKNAVGHKNKQLADKETELETYRTKFGDPEQSERLIQLNENLYGFEEKDGQLVSKVPVFAAQLFESNPDKAIELTNSLVAAPSPRDPNKTVFEEILELPEVENYLKEKFSVSADTDPNLEIVPDELKEAYKNLPEDVKQNFRFESDAARKTLLANSQRELVGKQAEATRQAEEQQRQIDTYNTSVSETTEKNFDAVTTDFRDQLRAIPFSADEKTNAFLQSTVYDKVMTVASMSETKAGKQAIEDLKAFGIEVPADVPKLVNKLENDSKLLTTATFKKNAQAVKHYESEITTTIKTLAGRANSVAAAIAKAVTGQTQKDAEKVNEKIADIPARPVPKASGGENAPEVDFTNVSYEDLVNQG